MFWVLSHRNSGVLAHPDLTILRRSSLTSATSLFPGYKGLCSFLGVSVFNETIHDVLYRIKGHDICGFIILGSSLMDLERLDLPLIVAIVGNTFQYNYSFRYLSVEISVWIHENNEFPSPLHVTTCY